jgi:hypothetical protein
MEMANTLAYYNTATITDLESFIVQAPEYNEFTTVDILEITRTLELFTNYTNYKVNSKGIKCPSIV